MKHKIYGKNSFVFSPICEFTTIFDDILRINKSISLYELLEAGWEFV